MGSDEMPKMSDHEEFMDATMVATGDLVVLLDEGEFREPEETGLARTVFQIRVSLPDGRKKTWTMNKTSRKNLAKVYGDDSAGWVNRQVRIKILQQNVRGEVKDVIYGHPVEGGPLPQQKTIDSPASKAAKIKAHILKERPDLTDERVASLVAEELKNSGGVFNEDTAAILVARTLGVNLEISGIQVARAQELPILL